MPRGSRARAGRTVSGTTSPSTSASSRYPARAAPRGRATIGWSVSVKIVVSCTYIVYEIDSGKQEFFYFFRLNCVEKWNKKIAIVRVVVIELGGVN